MTTARTTARLRIGPDVRLEVEGGTREFTEFQRALVLLLADAGRAGLGRDRASSLLWDDSAETVTTPRRRLRQLVYGLNRRSGMDLVQAETERITLSLQVEVVWLGESLAERVPAPTRAFAIVLDEIEGRAIQRSRADLISVLDAARAADDPGRILEVLRLAADASPLWRDGVWALLRSGRMHEAESLLRDLGIDDEEVLEECRSVLRRLLAGELATASEQSSAAPLIGRLRELAEVTRAIETGETRVAVVGPNGVGLSRLLGAASAWTLTEMDDLVVASARCTATGRSVPYDTLNRLFDSDLFRAAYSEMEEPWKSVVARVLVRAIGEEPAVEVPRLEGTSATLRVLHGIAGLVEKAVGRAQLLAVIDDLHHADAASLTVLIHLGYEGEGPTVRMLASVRTDTDASSPIEGFLAKEARVVNVPPLTPSESAELVQALHPEVDDEDAATLAALCDGFPRRIVEASRSVSEAGGHLEQETLNQLLRRRLDDLTTIEQDVMALLSLQPGGADANLLMATSDVGTLQLAQAIGELDRRGLVREEADLLHVTSPFLRHRVAEGIPPLIRKALHERVARQLRSRSPIPAAEVGHHFLHAGLRDEAATHLVQGAHQAADEEAFPVAIELMHQARAASSDPLPPSELDFWGELLEAEGRFGEAVDVYAEAEAGWGEVGEEEKALWARLGWLRAGVEVRERDAGEEAVRGALHTARRLGLPDLEALAIDLLFRIADDELSERLTWRACDELECARAAGSASVILHWVEVRRAYIDDPDTARQSAWRYHRSTTPGTRQRLAALNRVLNQGILRGDDGDPDVHAAAAELRSSASRCDPSHLLALYLNLGDWYLERGELDSAEAELEKSRSFVRSLPRSAGTNVLVNLAEIAVLRGNLERADDLMRALDLLGDRAPRDRMFSAAIRALVALDRGQISQAKAHVADFGEFSFSQPLSCFPMTVLKARVRLFRLLGDRERIRREIRQAESRARRFFPRMVAQVRELGIPDEPSSSP